jgi:hypothetical protein
MTVGKEAKRPPEGGRTSRERLLSLLLWFESVYCPDRPIAMSA